MGTARFAATVAAAAFLAGASVALPQATAIATADDSATGSAETSNSTDAGAGHPARAAKPGPRGSVGGTSGSTPRAAAARTEPSRPAPAAAIVAPTRKSAVTEPAAPDISAAGDVPTPAAASETAANTKLTVNAAAATVPDTAPAATVPDTAPAATVPDAAPLVTAVSVPTPAASAGPSPARPGAVASVTASATANATSAAALIDKLLAPISKLFGEGTALLIRRSLFNQAPTVAPVQLTGQGEGPITGTIGAVDPEGDPLSYTITSTPLHGSAVVNPDGSYTYTPGGGFNGADNFVVAVTDGGGGRHINLLDLSRPASTSANVAVTQGVIAAMLRFQFLYGSGSQYWSSAARSALESAANRLASSIVVTSPVTVTFDVTGEKSPFSSTLASAGSDFVPGDAGFLQTVVQNKILTGQDANGSAADGTIDWNFGPSWAFGSTVSGNQYDFESIAMHEMLHTLGFMSNVDKAGSNTGKVWTVFDSFVTDSAGAHPINSTTYVWDTAFNKNLTGGNGGMYFSGPQAVAANGGPVALYTPNPWEPGSSMSHTKANYLMRAVVSTGPGIRDVSPVELAILSDIGYTTTGSGTLLFVGFIGLRLRRRRD